MTEQSKQPDLSKMELRVAINDSRIKTQLVAALPSHCTVERFTRTATTAILRNPKLGECSKPSFFNCLYSLAQWGLEPDGRNAHLIPRWNGKTKQLDCTLIIDYKGYVELAYRSGLVAAIHADVVHWEDEFVYNVGQVEKHIIEFRKPRGEPYAVYCKVTFRDGTTKCEAMSIADVTAIRDSSEGYKASKEKGFASPWDSDFFEMAKKTSFRRLSKWLSISPEFRDALESDDSTPERIVMHDGPKGLTVGLEDETVDEHQQESESTE